MSTNNCGCNEITVPFVESSCNQNTPDCGCPIPATDASCIYYNLTTETNGLSCLSIANGTNLKTILEAIDTKLCEVTPFNFSIYDLKCLTDTYVINNFKDFAEATANEICTIKGNITTINNQLYSLNQLINTINVPVISNSCLGILPTDTIKQVLQKIVDTIDCIDFTPADSSPVLNATNSSSISFTTSGTKNHNITATVRKSASAGNILELYADGLFVPTPAANVPQVLSFNSLTRVISLSGGGGSVTLPPDLDNQVLNLNIGSKLLSISNGNTVDLSPLFSSISVTETPLTVNDSNSIDFTASGTSNHVLTGSVRIDNTQPNGITVSSNGLFVPQETNLTTVNSNSITLTTTGTKNHNLQADVKVDTTQANALSINANGLYVAPSLAVINARNGISESGGFVELGGSLTKHTYIKDDTNQYNIAIKSPSVTIGSEANTYLSTANDFNFGVINKEDITSNSLVNANSFYTVCFNNAIVGTGKVISAANSVLRSEITENISIPNSTPITGSLSQLQIKSLNKNITTPAGSGISGTATRAVYGSYNGIQLIGESSANTSTVSNAAAIVSASPYYSPLENNFPVITNYYGLLINPSDTFSATITNKYGIYQEGINDTNYFAGKMVLKNSYTPTSSADTAGQVGSVSWDDNYIYIKTNAGWKRTSLSTF